jgi:hypothetical protein
MWSELSKNLLPMHVARTLWSFLTDPVGLVRRARAGDLSRESTPITFYIASVSLSVLLFTTLAGTETNVSWNRAFQELSGASAHQFERFFNLTDDEKLFEWVSLYVPIPATSDAAKRIRWLVGSNQASDVALYLAKAGQADLGQAILKAGQSAEVRRSRDDKIGLFVAPVVMAVLSFLPHWILRAGSHESSLAALLYYQGFWLFVLAIALTIVSHWVGPLASDRTEAKATMLMGIVFTAGVTHLLIVLFITTTASIERILVAACAWIVAPVPIAITMEIIFTGINRML